MSLRLALAQTSANLRASVRGRYAPTDQLHVTLAFLGQVPGAQVPGLCAVLERACSGVVPFRARLAGLGSFGRRSAAVLWQGFDGSPFDGLAAAVRGELEAAGYACEDSKSFLAHVTLMRKADLESGILPMPTTASGLIETVTLFASELSPEGPRYTALHGCALSGEGVE